MRRDSELVSSWDEMFMSFALSASMRSKDPSTQVGACIASEDHHVLSVGYNGSPRGFSDDEFPWGKTADSMLNTKYPYVVHAERNAVLNFRGIMRDLRGSVVYVTHFPCNNCAQELAMVGVGKVVYLHDHDLGSVSTLASMRILEKAGIECVPYNEELRKVKQYILPNDKKKREILKDVSEGFTAKVYLHEKPGKDDNVELREEMLNTDGVEIVFLEW